MNKGLARQKGLITGDDDRLYKSIESIYKYLFEVYLISKMNIKKYDDSIKNSPYFFGEPHINGLVSGTKEYLPLNYIYLLNNFFIEKLEEKDIEELKDYIRKKDYKNNDEIIKLIERTYKEVIKNNYTNGSYSNEKYSVCYGAAIPSNFASNEALVFKIFYGKNTKELQGQEFIDNLSKQKDYLKQISFEIEKEVLEALNIPCKILIEKVA